jgi:hypothetical protein
MPMMSCTRATLVVGALALAASGLLMAQAPPQAGAPQPPAQGAPGAGPGGQGLSGMMAGDPNSAMGQKAANAWPQMAVWAKMPDITGSGRFPASYAMAPNGLEYVVYQPVDLAAAATARKLGVYIWGNGGCSPDGATARFHLTEIASRGFVAIASGRILSGPKAAARPEQGAGAAGGARGSQPGGGATAEKMISALDWILAENQRQGSPYYQRIDANRVAIGGNSCGGLIAMKASLDPRAKSVSLQNTGTMSPGSASGTGMNSMGKDDLAKFRLPVLYINGGPEDIAQPNALDDFKRINHVPVFLADHPGAGHVGLFLEPNGEATKIELDWILWRLDGDKAAARTFEGADCGLCRDFRWAVHKKGMK